jgi:predicted transcriptional regulator
MSYSVELEKLAKDKQKAREIVKEILDFGVNEQQKLQIIYELSLNLETPGLLKSINEVLKLYRKTINKEEETDDNKEVLKPKLIID